MMEDQGRTLVRQILWICTGLVGSVAVIALSLRELPVAVGYLCGVLVGLLSVGSLVYLVYYVLAPRARQVSRAHQRAAGVILALGKYLLIAAVLYVSIVHLRVNLWALGAGLATPTLVACIVALFASLRAPAPSD